MKKGIKTSEFWGKTLLQVLTLAFGLMGESPPLDEQTALTIVAGLEAIYTVARAITKTFQKENA